MTTNINYSFLFDFCQNNLNNLHTIKIKYFELINELTIAPIITDIIFLNNLKAISDSGCICIGWVGSFETNDFEIIGSGTVYLEPKLIRNGQSVGHIEDIVVKSQYRGNKISQNILNKLKKYAEEKNCYKVILDCEESVCKVYKSNGFDIKGFQMAQYF